MNMEINKYEEGVRLERDGVLIISYDPGTDEVELLVELTPDDVESVVRQLMSWLYDAA